MESGARQLQSTLPVFWSIANSWPPQGAASAGRRPVLPRVASLREPAKARPPAVVMNPLLQLPIEGAHLVCQVSVFFAMSTADTTPPSVALIVSWCQSVLDVFAYAMIVSRAHTNRLLVCGE